MSIYDAVATIADDRARTDRKLAEVVKQQERWGMAPNLRLILAPLRRRVDYISQQAAEHHEDVVLQAQAQSLRAVWQDTLHEVERLGYKVWPWMRDASSN